MSDNLSSQNNDEDENSLINHGGNIYESHEEKYKDNLSSAITFFVCGAIGLIILVLNYFEIIKLFSKQSSTFILLNVVLALLFIAFIAIGYWSLAYSKQIKSSVSEEIKAKKEIIEWLNSNITETDIEASYDNDIAEEMKYFNRADYIKSSINEKFPEANTNLVESITDEYIEQLFN